MEIEIDTETEREMYTCFGCHLSLTEIVALEYSEHQGTADYSVRLEASQIQWYFADVV